MPQWTTVSHAPYWPPGKGASSQRTADAAEQRHCWLQTITPRCPKARQVIGGYLGGHWAGWAGPEDACTQEVTSATETFRPGACWDGSYLRGPVAGATARSCSGLVLVGG